MPSGSSAEDDAVSPAPSPAARPKARLPKALKPDELAAFQKAQDRRGIIYMSWVPPFMKPAKLKHLMSQYGEVDRIFLRPEGELRGSWAAFCVAFSAKQQAALAGATSQRGCDEFTNFFT
eukprot:m.80995 g.80995  ORF g.80995 m.80995 type:complete len:120 (+) comp8215_c0_seq1:1043-1402(+)